MNIERYDTAILFDEERIALSWKSEDAGYRGQEVWDAAAPNFAKMPIPTGDDPFIRMLDDEVEFTPDMRVLDIGCGSGIYGLALASRVGEVVGIDISPKMIEAAREKACALDARNVRFVQGDFRDMAFDGGFDLVFAHMTPAIGDSEAFMKMMSLAKRWCYFARPVRRTDEVLFEARRRCGLPESRDPFDTDFLSAFSLAWLRGYTPEIRRYHDVWNTDRPLEEAIRLYADRLVSTSLDEGRKAVVEEYLRSIAQEGIVREHIETTVVMMGFCIDEGRPA
ncbi:class I SAM-dependent methyltransferase [Slackia exigua]|uniref:class I SAM-dependent methyltransferase n=1 Tax=Slackia exigua TaxID=84109 RepID=UPI00210E6889|nr:class I SAM-dependent methyltransferase [Slackia exigua]MCQ5091510.1 class I SAM-dependent methyltransferase [Slackia exigua]